MEKTEVEDLVTEMFNSACAFAQKAVMRPNGILLEDEMANQYTNAETQPIARDVQLGMKIRRLAQLSPDVDLNTLLFVSGVCYGKTGSRDEVQSMLLSPDGEDWPMTLDELRTAAEKLRDLIVPRLSERVQNGISSYEQANQDAAMTCWMVGCAYGSYLTETSGLDKALEDLR